MGTRRTGLAGRRMYEFGDARMNVLCEERVAIGIFYRTCARVESDLLLERKVGLTDIGTLQNELSISTARLAAPMPGGDVEAFLLQSTALFSPARRKPSAATYHHNGENETSGAADKSRPDRVAAGQRTDWLSSHHWIAESTQPSSCRCPPACPIHRSKARLAAIARERIVVSPRGTGMTSGFCPDTSEQWKPTPAL